MLENEQWKLLSNSNGHNFSLGRPIQAHNISRLLKLYTEALRKFKTAITFDSGVCVRPIIDQDTKKRTTEALVKFKWSYHFTRMLIHAHNITRRSKLNTNALGKFKRP